MPIELPQRDPCPYCENFAGRYGSHGPPAVLHDDDRVHAFLNPASLGGMPGHVLVIPKRHVETIFDLREDEAAGLAALVLRVANAVRDELDPDGVLVLQRNGTASEQTVPHVLHVIPQRRGAPFPPAEWIEVTPNEERQELAGRLRARLELSDS